MSVLAAVASQLKENADVRAVVGDQIFLTKADQRARAPYIVIRQNGREGGHHQTAADGKVRKRIQVNPYETDTLLAEALEELIRLAMDGMVNRTLGAVPYAIDVDSVQLTNDSFAYQVPTDGSDEGLHTVAMEFEIWHDQAVPVFA